jgi:PAS domain S-box-containing protein
LGTSVGCDGNRGRRSDEVVLQHEQLYRLAVEQVADYAIFMIGLDGRIASWNVGVQHVLGWSNSEWVGQPVAVIFTSEDIASAMPEEELERARTTGCTEDDRWHVRKNGTKFWASGITTALRDESGNITGFLKVMRDLTERKRAEERQATQLAVSTVLAESPSLTDAGPKLLEAICTASGWRWGAIWTPDRNDSLHVLNTWNNASFDHSEFEEVSRRLSLKRGQGLPGSVWSSGNPQWVTDVAVEENFPRGEVALRAELRGAICFPVSWQGNVLAVMEFFSRDVRPPEVQLLGMMTLIGAQIGQFIDRKLTEARLRATEARRAAGAEAAIDCIVSMDHYGLVTEWNPAAEQTFGYRREEAIGSELASLIIPPPLRDAHRAGLTKYLQTGDGPVVGKRIEISACRKGGEEFPVELSITRLPSEVPAFTGYLRDITHRKHADQSLRKSEARFRFLSELGERTRDLTDPQQIMATIAETLGKHLRVSRCAYAEVEADSERFTIHHDYTDGCASTVGNYNLSLFGSRAAADQRAGRTLVIHDVDAELATGDGAAMFNAIGIKAIICCPLVRQGRLVAMMAVHQTMPRRWDEDEVALVEIVVERSWAHIERARSNRAVKEAKEDAEHHLAQWRAVVESMTEGLVLFDVNGNLLLMNPASLAMHGFASAEEMWQKFSQYTQLFELRDLSGSILPVEEWPLPRVLRGERFTAKEIELTRRDTGKSWVASYNGTPVRDASGAIILGVLTVRDVTEQRRTEAAVAESEARFRQLAETIPQLAWMAKPDGWIFWYNRRWFEYTGTTPEQMEGWGWQSVHDPAELPRVMEGWQRSISTGQAFEMEFPLKAADGKFRWFLTRCVPLRDGEGNILLWFGTNTDIEDRRLIAQEREQLLERERAARAEAERASHMKDEFLSTLSHELRTPLNAILGWSQILKSSSAKAEDISEGLDVIERNARVQTQIIEDLLDMSRIISGKVRLDVQLLDLPGVVQAAVDTVRPAADAKGIALHMVLDSLAGPVSGDPNRLQQVFWNLLSNSVKFTPKSGRIQVVLRRVNSHVEVSVSDNGEGIKPEFLPHVFDRFRQADASTTRRHGGLGLGLSIVKQLVELHGGSVTAKSLGAGNGATFTVSLPLTALQGDEGTDRRHPRRGGGAIVLPEFCTQLSGVRVLVVDDEPDAREMVRRLLEDCDAVVTTVGTADEAVAELRRNPVDVFVSDIGMPDEDGYSLMKRIRNLQQEQGGSVPAIALTAYARPEDRMRAVLAGFQMHVAKPVEPAELITMVASLAGRTQ